MKRRGNRIIFGSAIGLATIAVAIDHTRHTLPEPVAAVSDEGQAGASDADPNVVAGNPCGMGDNPCGLGGNPCGLGDSPCGLGDNPCGLGGNPCGLQ